MEIPVGDARRFQQRPVAVLHRPRLHGRVRPGEKIALGAVRPGQPVQKRGHVTGQGDGAAAAVALRRLDGQTGAALAGDALYGLADPHHAAF